MSHIAGVLAARHFSQKDVPSLVGRKYLITGGSNGIGLSAARTLYSHGAEVTIIGSQKSTTDAAVEYIRTGDLSVAPQENYAAGFKGLTGKWRDASADAGLESGEVHGEVCDFGDLNAVAELSKKLAKRFDGDRVDGVLLNAGIGINAFKLTKDGYEWVVPAAKHSHLTINCLAHLLMLSHLLPVLEKTEQAHPDADIRIVLQASELHRTTFGGPSEAFGGDKFRSVDEFKKDIGQQNLYARTKLGQLLIMKKLVQSYIKPTSKILVHSTHPGGVATGQTRQYNKAYGETVGGLIEAAVRPIMRSPDQGALSLVWAAVSPEARDNKYKNGTYFDDPAHEGGETSEANDQELIDNFWTNGLEVIKTVVGADGVGPFHA
ncbi:hypothetical protein BMF94_0613 [Rhodotorula taiwanensis]|uniref:Ketoreductase (KR) domain-containing protein n=1 Tax=Rhodotorula taiwanensis TaxID=741276 RepID=A0A2S5BI38_9BASI|nr:hypothetical protein BMF94_0613 [Rhodotorula taiwanensis]